MPTHPKMELNHQIVNSPEMVAVLPRFLMARGCLLLAISSNQSWQRIVPWCRLITSSTGHVARRSFFVSWACALTIVHLRFLMRLWSQFTPNLDRSTRPSVLSSSHSVEVLAGTSQPTVSRSCMMNRTTHRLSRSIWNRWSMSFIAGAGPVSATLGNTI